MLGLPARQGCPEVEPKLLTDQDIRQFGCITVAPIVYKVPQADKPAGSRSAYEKSARGEGTPVKKRTPRSASTKESNKRMKRGVLQVQTVDDWSKILALLESLKRAHGQPLSPETNSKQNSQDNDVVRLDDEAAVADFLGHVRTESDLYNEQAYNSAVTMNIVRPACHKLAEGKQFSFVKRCSYRIQGDKADGTAKDQAKGQSKTKGKGKAKDMAADTDTVVTPDWQWRFAGSTVLVYEEKMCWLLRTGQCFFACRDFEELQATLKKMLELLPLLPQSEDMAEFAAFHQLFTQMAAAQAVAGILQAGPIMFICIMQNEESEKVKVTVYGTLTTCQKPKPFELFHDLLEILPGVQQCAFCPNL